MTEDLYFKTHVFCCTNKRVSGKECCADKNAESMRNYMKNKAKEMGLKSIRINSSGCLDRCEEGPVMVVYPQGVWYKYNSKEDIDEILKDHIKDGNIIERLILT